MRRPFSLLAARGVVGQVSIMTNPTPWFAAEVDSAPDGRRHAPATLRNRDALLAVLRAELPASGAVLEIASGTGEHAVFFAAALPNNIWQPSDAEPSALESIRAWVEACDPPLRNVLPPVMLDVGAPIWPVAAQTPFSPPISPISHRGPRRRGCSRAPHTFCKPARRSSCTAHFSARATSRGRATPPSTRNYARATPRSACVSLRMSRTWRRRTVSPSRANTRCQRTI